MDSGLLKTIGLALVTILITFFVARADGDANQAAGTIALDTAGLQRDTSVTPKWVDDANVLALIGTMNNRQMEAADLELSAWHSDTVRALAASMYRDHAALQRATDSVATEMHLVPVPSALGASVNAAFQAQIDSTMTGRGGMALDRGYVAQQLASHSLMATYLDQMAEVTERPELKAWLDTLGTRVDAQIARAKTAQATLAAADSIVADSLKKRAARRAHRDSIANGLIRR